MLSTCTLLGMLGICSIEDIRRKEIHSLLVMAFGIIGIAVHLYLRNETIGSLIAGVGIGVLMILFGILSKGMIGIGDGLVMLVAGIYLGGRKSLCLLCLGMLLAGASALLLILLKKKKKTDELPFIPFLFAAYLGMILL